MNLSTSAKLIALVCIIATMVVGISIGGPKFINAIQMQFGSKGKVDLLERCMELPGCSIGPADLEFYERYRAVRGSDAAQKIKDSEAVQKALEE
jgi:hypothetical protein